MAHFRCPSCGKNNPVIGDDAGGVLMAAKSVHIPAADRCKKCGGDLLEPALAELEGLPFMGEMSAAEFAGLDRRTQNGRLQGLELRARLHERLGRSEAAAEDRRQDLRELDQQIAELVRSGASDVAPTLEWRAAMNERAGDQTQGARDRLLSADMHAALAGEAGAKTALAASPLTVALGGLALGVEMADAVAVGLKRNESKFARKQREELMVAGRAVGIGFCSACGGVVDVDAEGRCGRRHNVELRRYVVPEDVDAARAELADQATAAAAP